MAELTCPSPDVLVALIGRVQRGDHTALPALRAVLDEPDAVDRLGGDMARMIQHAVIAKVPESDLLVREVLPRKLAQIRADAAGPNPTAIERLLAERVATTWLHLHYLEWKYASGKGVSLALAAHYERCITAAHKRYLAAIKTLATVRRLAVPVLQVNIARRQVNVACDAAAAGKKAPVG